MLCEHETQIIVRRRELPRHITILSWQLSRRGWKAKKGPTESCSSYGHVTEEATIFRMRTAQEHPAYYSKEICDLAHHVSKGPRGSYLSYQNVTKCAELILLGNCRLGLKSCPRDKIHRSCVAVKSSQCLDQISVRGRSGQIDRV